MKEIQPDLELWKRVWAQHRPNMQPNRLSGAQMRDILLEQYAARPFSNPVFEGVVLANLAQYPYLSAKTPQVLAFTVACADAAAFGLPHCFVGLELESGYIHCEGSDSLQDALFLRQGLNEEELENPFLVWRYVALQEAQ